MSKHTQGPWKYIGNYRPDGDGFGWFVEIAPERWASVEGLTFSEAEANAHLIAAAPELLEALKWLTAEIKDCAQPSDWESWEACQAAIAKAEGEA